jgi:aspartate/methionine/tyrosine aminotransferase
MAKTKQTLFVIFAGVQQQVAFGTCSIAQDASLTMMRSKAARFYTFADAKEFAEKNHIAFNGFTYIGLEDFTDLDMQG